MKIIFIFVVILISFSLVRCSYIEDTKSELIEKKYEISNQTNDYIIKRHIFSSDILKRERLASTHSLNKDKIIYHGKIYFVYAPKFLPLSIREKYRKSAYNFYQLVVNDSKYISEMKNTSFYALEIDENFASKINQMERNHIAFIVLNDGYAVFMFEDIKISSNIDKEKLALLKFNHKEKKYMNALYYGKNIIRNYSVLINITNMSTNTLIASYKGNNIYLKDLYNDFLNDKLKNNILNETNQTTAITIFEEHVFRPFIEKIYFSSIDMKMHPIYNMYLQGNQKVPITNVGIDIVSEAFP